MMVDKQARSPARRAGAAVLALALAVSACDSAEPTAAPAPTVPSAQVSTQEFARTLALALDGPETRALVHGAMSGSRFNEHKLVLQSFLETPEGGSVVNAMAAAGGVDASVVRGWAGQMPRMDFYVPFVEHRRAWTGTADLVVAANLDVDETRFTGYTPSGEALQFDSRAGTPRQTVIFMHPAEPKALRLGADGRQPGLRTIEDPSQPVYDVTWVDPIGNCMPDVAIDNCSEEGGSSGGGSGGTGPSTYYGKVYSFINHEGDGVGGVELMVKHYVGQGGVRISEEIMDEDLNWTLDGAIYDYVTFPDRLIKFATTGTTWIKVWERDSGISEPSGDDFWGEGAFGGFYERHRFSTYGGVSIISGLSSCYNYQPSCGAATVDITYVPTS